jgi:mRNA interferase HigB
MHVITRRRLREFWEKHPDARTPLATWFGIVRRARYADSADVTRDFASVSFLGDYRTVFNIGGNKYRLVVDMRYDLGRVYIRDVLTHQEYTRRSRAGTL